MSDRVQERIEAYRAGEDPDLSQLSLVLWELLFGKIPALTGTRSKVEQHRILEEYLVELGLPKSADLQYVAGPVLWYARERRVLPPPKDESGAAEPWTLDARLFEETRKTLEDGRAAFGDWMANALRDLLAEQR